MTLRAPNLRLRALSLSLTLLPALTLSARAADTPPAAAWLSSQTFAYAEIVRPTRLIDQITSPKVARLLKAVPKLNEALEKQEVQQLKLVANLVASDLDLSIQDALRDLASQGAILAVEGETSPERIILIVSPHDPALLEKAHNRLLHLARADADSKGKPDPVKQKTYEGVTTYSLSPKEAHAILDGNLVITNGSETLQTLIDRAQSRAQNFQPLAKNPNWTAQRSALDPDAVAFAFVRLDTLRAIDPKKFAGDKPDAGGTILLGYWLELLRQSPWASASMAWTDNRLAGSLTLAVPENGLSDAFATFRPTKEQGAPGLVHPPGTILSMALWRDLEAIWEVRNQLLPPEAVQQLAGLDSFAGQFFGGRDFGTGVLGSLGHDWRFVVANQDYDAMSPSPDIKYPAFALMVSLKPGDDEFSVRLQAAFQSFVGLVNLGAAQQKAPPLMLGSEQIDGITISKATYVAPSKPDDGPVSPRFNFSPSAMQVGNTFVLSSSVELARALVQALREPSEPTPNETLVAEADGPTLAHLVQVNREQLAMRNMLEKGNDRTQAESEIDLLAALLRYLGHGRLSVSDQDTQSRLSLEFHLGE